jgi:hypothetical protein
MRRLSRPTRRQAGAAAALGLTGLSAYAATRFSPAGPAFTPRIPPSAGSVHPVDFIPSADTPRIDGRLTLIWFSEPE